MGKFYVNEDERAQHQAICEDVWFIKNQRMLVEMANTDYGRDLLCIDKSFPEIIEFKKNHLTGFMGMKGDLVHLKYDFRIGAKWANVIRSRWQQFQSYSRYFINEGVYVNPYISPLTKTRMSMVNAFTFYPDPSPETTTVDGRAIADQNASWATQHDTTTAATASDSNGYLSGYSTHDAGGYACARSFTYFNTSSIGATDTKDSATYSLWFDIISNGDNDGDDWITVVQPQGNVVSSNTAIAASDYSKCGSAISNPTEGIATGTRKDLTSIATGVYTDFALNATGLSWVVRSGEASPSGATNGITYLGFREGHDVINSAITTNATNAGHAFSADTAGTGSDPKLVVEVSVTSLLFLNKFTLSQAVKRASFY